MLTKYLDEIVAAVIEGASRGRGDPEVAVDVSGMFCVSAHCLQVIVHLHERLAPEFLPQLLPQLIAILSTPPPAAKDAKDAKDANDKDREKEDKERISRQRPVLRIVAELAMVGAWPEGAFKGAAEVGKILKALVGRPS